MGEPALWRKEKKSGRGDGEKAGLYSLVNYIEGKNCMKWTLPTQADLRPQL